MKVSRFPLAGLNWILAFTGLCAFLFAPLPKSFAAPDANPGDVMAAAKVWLSLIDAGQYDESYTVGSNVFRGSITAANWVQALKTLRTPLGQVVSRKAIDHTYKPNGIRGLENPCVILTYDTSFAKGDAQVETIVLTWENGKWLGVSYTWGPKASETSDADSSPNSTTTTTSTHITPPPQPQPSSEPPPQSQPPPLPLPQ